MINVKACIAKKLSRQRFKKSGASRGGQAYAVEGVVEVAVGAMSRCDDARLDEAPV